MHDIRFPGESDEYRGARNRLLEAEIELRRTLERVASQRRASPPGGLVPEDHVFEEVTSDGGAVRFSELFAPGKDTLVIYSFMFPRWPTNTRPGPTRGDLAKLGDCRKKRRPVGADLVDPLEGPRRKQRLLAAVVVVESTRAWRRGRARSARRSTGQHGARVCHEATIRRRAHEGNGAGGAARQPVSGHLRQAGGRSWGADRQ